MSALVPMRFVRRVSGVRGVLCDTDPSDVHGPLLLLLNQRNGSVRFPFFENDVTSLALREPCNKYF